MFKLGCYCTSNSGNSQVRTEVTLTQYNIYANINILRCIVISTIPSPFERSKYVHRLVLVLFRCNPCLRHPGDVGPRLGRRQQGCNAVPTSRRLATRHDHRVDHAGRLHVPIRPHGRSFFHRRVRLVGFLQCRHRTEHRTPRREEARLEQEAQAGAAPRKGHLPLVIPREGIGPVHYERGLFHFLSLF